MNGRGGCCIAGYSGSGGGGISYGISKVQRIMLKFRPIAPKPVAAGSGSSCSTVENTDGYGGTRRRKRKYVRVNGKQNKKTKVSVPPSSSVSGGGDAVVTLPLMPETPDRKEKHSPAMSSQSENPDLELLSPIAFSSFNNQQTEVCYGHVQEAVGHVASVADHAVVMTSPPPITFSSSNDQQTEVCHGHVQEAVGHVVSVTDHAVVMTSPPPVQVVSFVTVECVTETWVTGDGPSAMNMEMDTCPSFITDNRDTVVWTNKSYREMISGGDSDEIVVKKYNRVTMPVVLPAFTCKVKVTWGTGNTSTLSPSTVTAPCDVWRLQSGGYAWRLDVKAALSLGR